MKRYGKLYGGIMAAVALLALLTMTATASGAYIAASRAAAEGMADDLAQRACKMEGGPVVWYAVDEEGALADEVEYYETETVMIAASFEYNCVPKNATIVTQWDIDGETVASFKEKLPASSRASTYEGYLSKKDESPLDDGEYTVTFFNNKTELTSGTVVIGGEEPDPGPEPGAEIYVEGTVSDKNSGKPINGAMVIVLQPETDIQEWIDNEMPEDQLYAAAKTSARGEFALEQPLERNVPYPFIVAAKGYKPILAQDVTFDDEVEDPVVLNIEMVK